MSHKTTTSRSWRRLFSLLMLLAICSGMLQPALVLYAAEAGPRPATPLAPAAPHAVPLDPSGDIDATFDGDGLALSNFATVYSFAAARAAARQSTGKIVLAGESVDNGQHHFALLRLTTSGLQDPTWGNGGEAKLAVGSSDLINDIAVQADDKVVAVGFSSLTVNTFTIMRYDADGALDTAFGGNNTGYITVEFPSATSPLQRANAVAIQDDGKIVVAGYRRDNTTTPTFAGGDDVALVRLNTNGTLDTSFGNGGKVVTSNAADNGSDQALDVLIIGSGASRKILVGGRTKPSGDNPQNMLLVRYNNDGTLDTTFDGDGKKVHDIPNNSCWPQGFACGGESIRAMALQPDGKIVATGGHERYEQFPSTSGATDTDMITVRFNADGSLDTTFGGANATNNPNGSPGVVITSVARGYYTDIGLSIAVEPDGQIVTLGYTDQSEDFPAYVPPNYNFYYNQNFLIQRLNANGSRDGGFGPSPAGTFFQPGTTVPPGVVVVDLSEEGKTYDIGHSVVLQSDGKIVGAGRRTFQDAAISDTYFGAVRLNTNGTVDYTYGPDKNTTGSLNGTPDGTPDGYFYAQMLGGSIDVTNGIARQSNNKVVLAGYTNIGSSQTRFALARLNTDGSLDTSFSGDGLATAGAPGQLTNVGNAIAIQSDGKIVVTGESHSGAAGVAPALTTMRFNTDGSLDASFSGDGIATNTWGTNANTAYAVAIQPNGKILVGGSVSSSAADWNWLLVRYNADGTLDTSFDGDGRLERNIGTGQNYDYIHAIVVQPDDNIVVGGYSSSSSGPLQGSVFALARYSSTGVVDSSFTTPATGQPGDEAASTPIPGGGVFTRLSAANLQYAGDQIRGLALMADGRIVAAGKALNNVSSGYNTFALARYMPNGRLDTSFSGDGLQTHNVAADTMDEIMGVALQHDEKIVAFGNALFLNGGSADVKVARFNWDDGSLDTTYATSGYVLTNISGYDRPVGGAVIPSGVSGAGKAIVGANPGSADLAALRYQGDPPPKLPGAPDLIDASDSGRFNNDNLTNDDTPSFSGTCETGETIIMRLDGAMTNPLSRAICRNGAYTVTSAVDIPDGPHTISVLARNGYGDTAPVGSLSITIDTIALPPNIIAPTANAEVLPNPGINGDGMETLADFAITYGASIAVCSGRASAAGVWSCSTTLNPGSYTINVRQTDIAGNTSNPATRFFKVKAPTTTTLTQNKLVTVYGENAAFTAVVNAGIYGTPDGPVRFLVDTLPTTQTLSGGQTTLNRANLSVGVHDVVAHYQGAELYFPSSSSTITHEVIKADTTSAFSFSPASSVFGQSVTITVTVSAVAPGAGLATGNVTLKDGDTTLSTKPLNGSGKASFTFSNLSVGSHDLSASYAGDGNFNPSGTSASYTVNKAGTISTITADLPDPSIIGSSVVFSYTVGVQSPGAGMPSGTVTVTNGSDTCSASVAAGKCAITLNVAGTTPFTATYSGDGSFLPSTSVVNQHTVNKINTTTTITGVSPAPSLVGQTVTISYTVTGNTPSGFTPTGNVTIGVGQESCTASVAAGQCTITFGSAGAKSFRAVYAGDNNFNTSQSALSSHTVNKATTTTTITASSANPAVVGQPVTFSFSVAVDAPGGGAPTGNVTIGEGGESCTASVAAGQCTITFTSVGPRSLKAAYPGDANFVGSSSGALVQNVDKASTSLALASSKNPSIFGDTVTFTATVAAVAPGAGIPTGQVQFYQDGEAMGAPRTLSGGSVTITNTFLLVGTYAITATYSGDENFKERSGTLAGGQVVTRVPVDVNVSSSLNPAPYGDTVTFSVVIVPPAGTPTGTVQFFVDGSPLGGPLTVVSATAAISASLLTAGNHAITASYSGDENYEPSTGSLAGGQTVIPAATTSSLEAPDVIYDASGVVTVTVTSGVGIPTGSVGLSVDGGAPVTRTLSAGGSTVFTLSGLGAGTYNLSVRYPQQGNYALSTASGTLAVLKNTPAFSALSSPTITYGAASTTLSGMLKIGDLVPSGVVTVTLDGVSQTAAIGADGSFSTSFATGALPVDGSPYSIGYAYGGDANFNGAAGSGSLTVGKATPDVGVSSSLNPAVYGDSVTFTVVVSGTGSQPTGSVQFKVNGQNLGAPVALANGSASAEAALLSAGTHAVAAVYSGDANYLTATGTLSGGQVVEQLASTTALETADITYNASGVVTVTLSAAVGTPGGSVGLSVDGDDPITQTLGAGGATVFTVPGLGAGVHNLSASYPAQGNYAASSANGTLTVAKATSAFSALRDLRYVVTTSAITFSGVLRSGSMIPPGSVTVTLDGVDHSVPVDAADGSFTTVFATAGLAIGSYTVDYSYPGSANFTTASATSTLEIYDWYRTYLPLVGDPGPLPDLVVQSISTANGKLRVTIANVGEAPVTAPFWVDLYINPSPAPTRVNQTWPFVGTQGLAWGVTAQIPVSGTITLTVGDAHYNASQSKYTGPIPAGATLYAQVDSAGADGYGVVEEHDEVMELPYNNILKTTASSSITLPAPAFARAAALVGPRAVGLPARPQP